ncbi:hypothetical protein IMZ48_40655 [Candidatus Bathyarchaeota archaeon]|nr:hypothetical protein [Candidatus Bathyarchaeota archaeon]
MEKYADLHSILSKICNKETLEKAEMSSLKIITKKLYQDCLQNFHGIVCCTPVAARNYQFRIGFRPDLVLVDEGGHI